MEEKESMKKIMKENVKDVKHKTKGIHVDQELAYHAIVTHIHTRYLNLFLLKRVRCQLE